MASSTPKRVYTTEIASMVYVFTGQREPDDDLVHFLEDTTRAHLVDLAQRRNSRSLSVEDLLFLVRHDRAKVNRLRSYLSWKDVRKRRIMEPEADEELVEGIEEPVSDKALKVVKDVVRLPWELADQWADYLRNEDEPEDDEAEAYEVNKQRLKEAEEITRNMSKDEYELYAQARQASFVYRKSKKFRDFLNFASLLDGAASLVSDEVLDCLGFLGYETVRALCDAAVVNKTSLAEARARVKELERRREEKRKRDAGEEDQEMKSVAGSPSKEGASPGKAADGAASPSKKRARKSGEATSAVQAAADLAAATAASSPPSKPLEIPTSLFSAPLAEPPTATPALGSAATFPTGEGAAGGAGAAPAVVLQLQDVAQGYQAVQHSQQALKTGGMRNWRGGLTRLSSRLV
ncbi:hypothetical protein JCM8097_005978 [Rhodosporidiobolus ruineniae]